MTTDSKDFLLSEKLVLKDGTELTSLKLYRMKAGKMKTVELDPTDGKIGGVLKFVALMNGISPTELDELDGGDMLELVGEVSPFLARRTGGTPSR